MDISVKKDVSYTLDKSLRTVIIELRDIISNEINTYDIYIFGSVAKGKYSKNSDVDILVLIDGNNTIKELRRIKHRIEDIIEEKKISRDVDIKLYNKSRFLELSKLSCFEREILKDLVCVKEWSDGK